jgi:UDP:flavonoid glycosyltransferase YjiC (YdhE family)
MLIGEQHFDLIIHLGEIGSKKKVKASSVVKQAWVDPVVYFTPDELPGRREARRQLGLPLDHQVVLVSLGAANPVIKRDLALVLEALGARPRTSVVIAESIIGRPLQDEAPQAKFLREYPVSRYFNAFDAAVAAAGYSTVQESGVLGLPCVFIPNSNRTTDDQELRARAAEQAGGAICLEKPDRDSLARALGTVLDPAVNQKMRRAGMAAITGNGSEQAARLILGLDQPPQE